MTYVLEQGLYAYNEEGDDGRSIELLVRCQPCKGEGFVVDKEARSIADCQPCGGRGVRLGCEGQKLLRFVRDWQGHPDVNKEFDW